MRFPENTGGPLKEENHLAPNHHDFSFKLSIFRGCSWIYILPQPRRRSADFTTRMTWLTSFRLHKWIPRRPFINPNDTPNNLISWEVGRETKKTGKKNSTIVELSTVLGLNVSLKGFDTLNLGQTKIHSSQFNCPVVSCFWLQLRAPKWKKQTGESSHESGTLASGCQIVNFIEQEALLICTKHYQTTAWTPSECRITSPALGKPFWQNSKLADCDVSLLPWPRSAAEIYGCHTSSNNHGGK